jgi:hypothetical protein
MKTKIIILSFFTLLFVNSIYSQTRTTVNASNSEISDNLDLKAVASIFGDSKNLEDFENRLNNPKYKKAVLIIQNGFFFILKLSSVLIPYVFCKLSSIRLWACHRQTN